MYCAIVSAVPPDFDVTTKIDRVRSRRSSIAVIVRGSTLSSTCIRGCPPRSLALSAFHCGLSSAVRSAIGPSAEPPMPSTMTSSYLPRAFAAMSVD
jgi:hypothetical protein